MSIVLWAQEAVLLMLGLYWTVMDRYMQVLYLGRALRTKETLPDFLKWRRVTRHPLVFHGLTGSQRTPGFWGVTKQVGENPYLSKFVETPQNRYPRVTLVVGINFASRLARNCRSDRREI